MKQKIWTRTLQDRYEKEIVPKVDNMPVDAVVRFKRAEAPNPVWFYNRAELNLFIYRVLNIGEDVLVVRVK